MILLKISSEDEGKPIEDYLTGKAQVSPRSALKRAFQSRQVLVNGRPVSRQEIIHTGDQIEIHSSEVFTQSELKIMANTSRSLEELLVTSHLIVVNKPAGIPAHPLRPNETETALNFISARFPETAIALADKKPLEGSLVHRLDRGTSGALVLARDPGTWNELRALWSSHTIEKVYLSWLSGEPPKSLPKQGRFQLHLWHDPKSSKRMLAAAEAPKKESSWPADTSYQFLKTENNLTLALIRIHTGVTHQIRASFAALGLPVLGDEIYRAKALAVETQIGVLDKSTQLLFKKLAKNISLTRKPSTESLPEDAFFLHALWLCAHNHPELEEGILAPLPENF